MPSNNLASVVLRTGRKALATPPASTAIRRLGLQSTLSRTYWWLNYRAAGGTHERRVGDVEVAFRADSPDEFRHYRTLVDERPVLADLLGRLEPDDTVFDVGAYVGTYTCFAAAALPDGQVVAFEPREAKAARVEANLAHNGATADVRREALTDESGEGAMATDGVAQLSTDGTESVTMRRGDALVEAGEVPPPDVLKVDVEGAEVDALHGLAATLARPACRLVYCEVHPTLLDADGASEADVREVLNDCGFTVETIHDRGEEYFLRAEK
ncbi:FkbM family methyltransferase [Halomicrococcus sp. SG-WS-1]|uniref:FkbM family methyltransferase n=1 Tax=Halomicrococcus sp. SG-WS-1 TaxID=3439057 RepID=UPI003F7AE46C